MEPIKTYEDFQEKINGNDKIIVKFFADWCPDCTRMNMFIDPILEEYNYVDWYELNRDEVEQPALDYEVMGIPSLLIFKDGEKLAHLHSANAKTPEDVRSFLQEHL
jgi:thiol-disulfide isomerase/thioredoxin